MKCSEMAVIKDLTELEEADRRAFGTKAVNLGVLMRLGLTVPSGFAVATDVFVKLLAEVAPNTRPREYIRSNEEVIAALGTGRVPSSQAEEIESRVQALGGDRFSVRSSAGCEDGSLFSMAGVFESYIDLGPAEVHDAIIKCYCSLFNDRALDAMDRAGLDRGVAGMAIVVQRFVAGSPSGVLFTADPVRGDDAVIQLNAVDGWCQEAVSGGLPKARITLDKATGTTKEEQTPPGSPHLSAALLQQLADGARNIEYALGVPVDVEWTTLDGRPVYLQTRPLTGIRGRTFPIAWERPEDASFRWEEPTGPAPPLVSELHRMELRAGNKGAARSGLSFFHVGVTEQNGYLYFRQIDLPDAETRRAAHLARVRALAKEHKNIFTHEYLPQILELQNWASSVVELTADSPAKDLEDGIAVGIEYLRRVMSSHWLVVHGALSEDTIKKLRDRFGLSSSDVNDLLFTQSMLTHKRAALMEMAGLVRSDPELSVLFANHPSDLVAYHRLDRFSGGRKLLELFERFLVTYGLTRREVHLDYRIYAEAPHLLINEVRSLLGLNTNDHAKNLRQIAKRQSELTDRLTRNLVSHEAEQLRAELQFLRTSFTVRDDHGHYIDLGAVGYLRYVLRRIGERLANAGSLRRPADIEFLRLEEIRAAVATGGPGLRALVETRRRLFEEQRHLAAPPCIGAAPPEEPRAAEEPEAGEQAAGSQAANARLAAAGAKVRGYSGMAARTVGPVVTAAGLDHDPPARFILVLSHVREIDPAVYAGRVAGIVVEDGSPFDHIGIWARECGIPTLFSAEGITALVRDGDILEIDGIAEVARIG